MKKWNEELKARESNEQRPGHALNEENYDRNVALILIENWQIAVFYQAWQYLRKVGMERVIAVKVKGDGDLQPKMCLEAYKKTLW